MGVGPDVPPRDAVSIAAIPTMYGGIRFRSRLEARWAAFFDLCGFAWEYEPTDFKGWIPDFSLRIDGHGLVYAEVKPITEFNQAHLDKIFQAAEPGQHTEHADVWLLGTGLGDCRLSIARRLAWSAFHEVIIGETLFRRPWVGRYLVDPDVLVEGDLPPDARMTGARVIERRWAMASNRTQWKAPTDG
jgi:hypothetical protein